MMNVESKIQNPESKIIYNYLLSGGDLLAVSHFSPDGDAIGSLIAFSGMLDQLGVEHLTAIADVLPEKYSFLPGFDRIRKFDIQDSTFKIPCNRLVILDAGALPRIGSARSCIGKGTKVLNIDHHYSGPCYGDINIITHEASATAEILYDLCEEFSIEITEQIAYGLFVGILTDTGRFRFSNTSSKALAICADLISKGVNPGWVTENVYYNLQFENVQALARALSTIECHLDGLICIVSLDREKDVNDTEGFVEYASSITGVALAAFIREIEDKVYKISLRSRCSVDVAEVAAKFGGGGHLKAAGFRYLGAKEDLIKNLVDELAWNITAHKITRGSKFIERTALQPDDEHIEF
ncbi:bifunctional oligoribonuclease/PAP phosphatase NrnA [bacterium]|nr:bifunctional oligoribonuclease/PAP phosphatase NrnA [bacterium]